MIRKKTKHKTTDALKILDSITGDDHKMRQQVAAARLNAQVAQLIHDVRQEAGLTQRELAELIGTRQPVIARLEDADYEGHSLSMLQKIAEALDRRIQIRMPRALQSA